MTVVPGDEVGGAEAAVQLDAGDVQRGVVDGPGGEDHGVVVALQVLTGEVGAVVDVADEADLPALHDFVQGLDDPLDARVVRSHTVADEPEGGRVAVEEVDLHVLALLGAGEDVCCVDTGGAGADHGDAKCPISHGCLCEVVVCARSAAGW